MGIKVAISDLGIRDDEGAELTTERAESSYNQPVLIIDGEAYGPGDVYRLGDGMYRQIAGVELTALESVSADEARCVEGAGYWLGD